jgi:cellulose synthase/poly-beta-1,6-N-acetylglucosamine synthase-like glycosyltransferase
LPPISPTQSEVDVIVPCYNVEHYVRRALDSVLAQTHQDFWIYAVNDGCTDNTMQILETYAPRCVSISQAHAGPAAARNRAIRESLSPFIAFIDADDEWLPEKLERQIYLLRRNESLGMVCSHCLISESRSEENWHILVDKLPHTGRLFRDLVRSCFVFTPTVVVRRRCLEEIGLFNETLPVSEDFNLWLRIAARWEIAIVPEVLAIAKKRSGSLSATTPPQERLRSGVVALEHVQSSCSDLSPVEQHALRLALAERIYFYGSYLLSTGAKTASRQHLASALELQSTHWRAFAKLALSFLPSEIYSSLARLKSTIKV